MAAMTAGPSTSFLVGHLLGSSVGWASGFLFIKLGSAGVPPSALAAMRGLVAAAALTAFFLAQGRSIRPRGREWRDWATLGALNGWGPNMLVAYALTQIGTAPAAMIQASGPLIVALLAHLLFAEERLTARRMAGVLVGFSGMAILIGPAAFEPVGAAGALAMLATALSYALGNIYVRLIPRAEPARLALGQQIFSGVPAALIALSLGGPQAFAAVPANGVALLALGTLGTAIPILLFMRLIRRAGPTRAAMVGYLMPVWATLLAIVFLGERIGLREALGGAVVLAGVAIVSFADRGRPVA